MKVSVKALNGLNIQSHAVDNAIHNPPQGTYPSVCP